MNKQKQIQIMPSRCIMPALSYSLRLSTNKDYKLIRIRQNKTIW